MGKNIENYTSGEGFASRIYKEFSKSITRKKKTTQLYELAKNFNTSPKF